MKLLYSKIFKSNQVNVGVPVPIRVPISFQTVKVAYKPGAEDEADGFDSQITTLKGERVEKFNEILKNAQEQSDDIVKSAELEAQRIIEKAESEVDEMIRLAEDEASQKGFEKGYSEAKRAYEDLLLEAESIKKQTKQEYTEAMARIERDAVELVMDVTKKVIGDEISLNKDHIVELVSKALQKSSNRQEVIVKVSPEDYDYIQNNAEKILAKVDGVGKLDIKKEPSLKQGDCLLETPFGNIDAGVETKLRKIGEAFEQIAYQD